LQYKRGLKVARDLKKKHKRHRHVGRLKKKKKQLPTPAHWIPPPLYNHPKEGGGKKQFGGGEHVFCLGKQNGTGAEIVFTPAEKTAWGAAGKKKTKKKGAESRA